LKRGSSDPPDEKDTQKSAFSSKNEDIRAADVFLPSTGSGRKKEA